MDVTILSSITGEPNTMDLPVTEEQLRRHASGELAQTVFPHLSQEEREFLISGCTPEEQAAIFG